MAAPKTPKVQLATLPTPLHPLRNLSADLGIDLWIKRDDLTGFALGGNKVRKAEYLLGDALARNAQVLITAGAVQSNHARVMAAAAASAGLECHLLLSGAAPKEMRGNMALNHLAGAVIHYVKAPQMRAEAMRALAQSMERQRKAAYVVPIGGSNEIGARGYVRCYEEILSQLRENKKPVRIVFASSSGGTYAGLLAGRAIVGGSLRLLGIRVDDDPKPEQPICEVANALTRDLPARTIFEPGDINLEEGYVGEGYARPTAEGTACMELLWRREGILLEPVYTAKAMAGLVDLAAKGLFRGERVIFLHTGGAPAFFA